MVITVLRERLGDNLLIKRLGNTVLRERLGNNVLRKGLRITVLRERDWRIPVLRESLGENVLRNRLGAHCNDREGLPKFCADREIGGTMC